MKIITEEISHYSMPQEIIDSKADLLCTVAIEPEYEYQPYWRVSKELYLAYYDWARQTVLFGIGEYSLNNGPTSLFAQHFSKIRDPTDLEVIADIRDNSKMDPKGYLLDSKTNTLVLKGHMQGDEYVGPKRLKKSLFLTRIIPEIIPNSLVTTLTEVFGLIKQNGPVNIEGSYLFSADQGYIYWKVFADSAVTSDFKGLEDMDLIGRVDEDEHYFYYYNSDDTYLMYKRRRKNSSLHNL